MNSEKTLKEFDKWGQDPPSSDAHGTDDEIRRNLKRLMPHTWHLEGNKLVGETEVGKLVQFIPTDYICYGKDDKGLPILKKVLL